MLLNGYDVSNLGDCSIPEPLNAVANHFGSIGMPANKLCQDNENDEAVVEQTVACGPILKSDRTPHAVGAGIDPGIVSTLHGQKNKMTTETWNTKDEDLK